MSAIEALANTAIGFVVSWAATPSACDGRGLFIRNATNSRSPVPPRLHTDSRGGVAVNPGTNLEATL